MWKLVINGFFSMLQLCLMRVGQPDLEMTSKSEIEALHMKKVRPGSNKITYNSEPNT